MIFLRENPESSLGFGSGLDSPVQRQQNTYVPFLMMVWVSSDGAHQRKLEDSPVIILT